MELANMDLILSFAFMDGIGLVTKPWIFVIFPLVFLSLVEGGKKRALGIFTGFILYFCIFLFFTSWLIPSLSPASKYYDYVQYAAFILLGLCGLVLLLSGNRFLTYQINDFVNGLGMGALIGFFCTPHVVSNLVFPGMIPGNSLMLILFLLVYAIGASIPIFIIAFTGKAFMKKLAFHEQQILCKGLGAIILLTVIYFAFLKNTNF